jgi:transposase
MAGKGRYGRFTSKADRQFIAIVANGTSASQIARRFNTTLRTIERKAKALGISLEKGPGKDL